MIPSVPPVGFRSLNLCVCVCVWGGGGKGTAIFYRRIKHGSFLTLCIGDKSRNRFRMLYIILLSESIQSKTLVHSVLMFILFMTSQHVYCLQGIVHSWMPYLSY